MSSHRIPPRPLRPREILATNSTPERVAEVSANVTKSQAAISGFSLIAGAAANAASLSHDLGAFHLSDGAVKLAEQIDRISRYGVLVGVSLGSASVAIWCLAKAMSPREG